MVTPMAPDVGVVAVTDDSWNGVWTTRHFMLRHLARFFQVAWLEPMEHWRGLVERRWRSRSTANPGQSVRTVGVDGVTKCDPLGWLPEVYRPRWLRDTIRATRYAQAAASLRKRGCRSVVLYVWRPSHVDALDSRRSFDAVVYHIDDDYSFSETLVPTSPAEQRLIAEADAVIVHSPGLADRKGGINDNTHIVPNGVDFDLYARTWPSPADLSAIPGPRIGYAGVIKKQLDISLIRRLAERHPTWSFVLVGPLGNLSGEEAEMRGLAARSNVHLLGYRHAADLPAYQKHFDVCIMPYKVNAYTECIYPLKLHEYLASGKPVVATPVRTLRDFSHVLKLASDVDEWEAAIASYLAGVDGGVEGAAARQAVARRYDWPILAGRTATIMSSLLRGEVDKRVRTAIGTRL
jgi:glycosyltransferase involved in cell wall biosynthesis